MASSTADSLGHVTEKTLAHYVRLATSGAGLVFVEYSFVHHSGRSEENQLGVDNDSQIPGLTRVAEAIKELGALAGIQLTHAGGKTSRGLTDGYLQGPSNIRIPVKDREMDVPTAMTSDDIQDWKKWFLASAGRAIQAGFDVIELHAAHGYGINQWLSPITNQREDLYGGSFEGRVRLLLEIVRSIRETFPKVLVSVRMPGQDFLEGGISGEEAIEIAKRLEQEGVDLIDVSSGIGGWRRPRNRTGEGYLVAEAERIQKEIEHQ